MTSLSLVLAPTSRLPPLRTLSAAAEVDIISALDSLRAIYCPLAPPATAFHRHPDKHLTPPQADSGYTSGDDDGEDGFLGGCQGDDVLAELRADTFERNFAFRWLSSLILRVDELQVESDNERDRLVDEASCLLAALALPAESERPAEKDEDQDCGITRDFSFAVSPASCASSAMATPVHVRLFDADLSGPDHTNVGLQSWGASIVFSDLVCTAPERLGLTRAALGPAPRIVELGAGTGLVSLVLAGLLPRVGVEGASIVATDYHPAVLENLCSNVAANLRQGDAVGAVLATATSSVETCLLDWSDPVLEPPLHEPADLLVATDVIYEPGHALWLRDCAARLLRPGGTFWLVATVRPAGKFEGISDTVEAAFGTSSRSGGAAPAAEGLLLGGGGGGNAASLKILETDMLEKRKGVGRGDEIGYRLFKIGWA